MRVFSVIGYRRGRDSEAAMKAQIVGHLRSEGQQQLLP